MLWKLILLSLKFWVKLFLYSYFQLHLQTGICKFECAYVYVGGQAVDV